MTLLGKNAWSLMHDQHKLWVQLLSHKYSKDMFVLNGASYTWASIVKAVSILQPGFHFRLGRGSLSVWFDKCSVQISRDALIGQQGGIVPI